MKTLYLFLIATWLCCCSTDKEKVLAANETAKLALGQAKVVEVSVTGNPNNYIFEVTISSPDTGCDQYADWWEIVDLEGNLIHRRILAHSHVKEQPFTRSGGPLKIAEDTQVYVRAHMNTSSYGKMAQKGSIENGFIATELDVEYAKDLEKIDPLPQGCAY